MPKKFTSKSQKIGELGEKIAEKFLMKRNFNILDRNYTKKYGEIDIVAEKEDKVYFIEVKAVTRDLSRENSKDNYRAEDNMHPWKMKRLARTIQAWQLSHKDYDDKDWQIDLMVVILDIPKRKARVKVESDIIL